MIRVGQLAGVVVGRVDGIVGRSDGVVGWLDGAVIGMSTVAVVLSTVAIVPSTGVDVGQREGSLILIVLSMAQVVEQTCKPNEDKCPDDENKSKDVSQTR